MNSDTIVSQALKDHEIKAAILKTTNGLDSCFLLAALSQILTVIGGQHRSASDMEGRVDIRLFNNNNTRKSYFFEVSIKKMLLIGTGQVPY